MWRRYDQHPPAQQGRASKDRPASGQQERQATAAVRVDEEALEAAVRRLGWRIDRTNQPAAQRSLAPAVLASRSAYLVERRLGRLQGRPLSLTSMSGQRDDHATGRLRWLSMALRVWTLVACVVRRQLAAEEATGAGLYAGHAKRATARPTAERCLEALQEVTLTVVEGVHRVDRHLTALRPLQARMLELLGCSSRVYTRLCTVSHEPLGK